MDSQTTWGSIESLRRMVIENQSYQAGFKDQRSKIKADEFFKELFFPQSENWKKSISAKTLVALQDLF